MIIVGHRGAAGHAPENTLAAIRRGMELGADWIEIDVQLTRDGEAVVFHDKLLDRVTARSGYLRDHTYEELLAHARVGAEEPIPRFASVCDLVKPSRCTLMVEIIAVDALELVMEQVARSLPVDRVVIASFHHALLLDARRHVPGMETLALFEGAPVDPVRMVADAGSRYAGLGFESISAPQVQAMHEGDVKVLAWTVNDPRDIERARRMGVDGIITDYPDRVRSALAMGHTGAAAAG